MNISIIIPAYNAAITVSKTLESLLAQTYSHWEAIVIDDGSVDNTKSVVERFAQQDERIHIVNQPNSGGCAARNRGIKLARYDWLLFLDADDWILPHHLERMTDALRHNPDLDAVHCGWTRITPAGEIGTPSFAPPDQDLFPAFARYCAFMHHTCVIRRSIVEAVGGYDTSLQTCQDWDFWQRVSRTGTRFGSVKEVLARYLTRPSSISLDGLQLHQDGLRVISQGHAPDPRVRNPHPRHFNGQPQSQLADARLCFAGWSAGLVLGSGQDPISLLKPLQNDIYPELNPETVAINIFEAARLPRSLPANGWDELWLDVKPRLTNFLEALARQSQAPNLAVRSLRHLERLILENSKLERPITLGATHSIRLEITDTISDISPPPQTEQLECQLEIEGETLGTIVLPVSGKIVPAQTIADAIAAEYAWAILKRFFTNHIYPQLTIVQGPTSASIWRDDLYLGNVTVDNDEEFWSQVHDKFGWAIFLQELWGRPHWPGEYFYNDQIIEASSSSEPQANGHLTIDLTQDLVDITSSYPELDIALRVGSTTLENVIIPVPHRIIPAHKLRVALTQSGGFELCQLVVREALIGQPLVTPATLRGRLVVATRARALS